MTGRDFTVEVADLARLQADVRDFPAALRTALDKRLGAVAQAGAGPVRTQLRTRPHHIDVGLAEGLAAGTKVVRARGDARTAGAAVVTTGERLSANRQAMVYAFNKPSFRRPVFGHRDRMVTQSGRPYFGVVLDRRRADAEAGVNQALADAAGTVTAGRVNR